MPIDNGLKTVSDLFGGDRLFEIPIYQRPYAWEEQQVRDLLEDLRYLGKDKEHFFGTVLVKDSGRRHPPYEIVDVVDGQQRLTTLQILMSEALRRLKGNLEERRGERLKERYVLVDGLPKLSPASIDARYFQDHILGDVAYPNEPLTPSQTRLKKAKQVIRDFLSDLKPEEASRLLDQAEKLRVLVYTVNTDGEAALVFETTNDRGKPLSTLEKTKSFVMHQLYLAVEKPEPNLSAVNDAFSAVYRMLDYLEDNPVLNLDEDVIQRYHFILFEDWQSKRDYQNFFKLIRSALNEKSRNGDSDAIRAYVEKYCRDLLSVFTSIKEMLQSAEASSTEEGRLLLDVLFGLGFYGNFIPLLSAAWIETHRDPSPEKRENLIDLLRAIEKFSFRTYVGGRKRSDAGQSELYTLGWEVFNGEKSVLEALRAVEDLGRGLVSKAQFEGTFRSESYLSDSYGGYVRYLLWKYEEAIRVGSNPKEPLSVSPQEIFSDKVEIEHILPRNAPIPNAEKEHIIDRLGNLALASKPANASMSDRPFAEKRSKYLLELHFQDAA